MIIEVLLFTKGVVRYPLHLSSLIYCTIKVKRLCIANKLYQVGDF